MNAANVRLYQLNEHMPYIGYESRYTQMMSFILVSKSGEIVLIDGGDTGDADYLLRRLRDLGGEKPHIKTWYITHGHEDHVNALYDILIRYPDAVTIGQICHNVPDRHYFATLEAGSCLITFDRLNAIFQKYPSAVHRVQEGEKFEYDGFSMEVLYVPQGDYVTINDTSVVYRMDAENQSVLFLGDLSEGHEDELLKVGGKKCYCDIVQMAHHGQGGVSEKFYRAIKPKAALWCTPEWLWNNDNGDGFDTYIWKTVSIRRCMKELEVLHNVVTKDGEAELVFPLDFENSHFGIPAM